jgi:hypothetical protein
VSWSAFDSSNVHGSPLRAWKIIVVGDGQRIGGSALRTNAFVEAFA